MPLLEAQYRDHGIDMKGPRLLKAVRKLLDGHGLVFIALDPQPIGVAVLAWEWSLERAGRQAWLEELYVVPDRRGQGIGRKLLVRSFAEARKAGCVSIELEVLQGHGRSSHLYLREGFERLARTRYSRDLKPEA